MPFTLISFAAAPTRGLSSWRPEDYTAYKLIRAVAGRRIAGSTWLPGPDGRPVRLTNASREIAVNWFIGLAVPCIEELAKRNRRSVLVPLPGLDRVVGAPPSQGRLLAQELSTRTGLRMVDMLRWRQKMPRCRQSDTQMFMDNVVTSGAPVRAECILVGDFVSSAAPLQAIAATLRQSGSLAVLAVAAGRAADPPPADPFETTAETIEDLAGAHV
jgi:hypothetical protein